MTMSLPAQPEHFQKSPQLPMDLRKLITSISLVLWSISPKMECPGQ
uniref:Alternative protein CD96 n=1 Tax=Homo sapiens TaxID=9606 RepID=L8EAH0_HUMAN|nr:alternative protein CD96 [Homo sapiens]